MTSLWHRLARNALVAWLTVPLGCGEPEASHSIAPDGGETAPRPYVLCDGSEQVRLGIQVEGGHVDQAYSFTDPLGHAFLFIDGKCNFVAKEAGDRDWSWGALSPEQGAQIAQQLELSALVGISHRDRNGCPDSSTLSFSVAGGYGEVGCQGDEKTRPAMLTRAAEKLTEVLAMVKLSGRPPEGAVEVLVLSDWPQGPKEELPVIEWPFAWPVSEVAVTSQEHHRQGALQSLAHRALHGSDAERARLLRSDAERSRGYAHATFVREKGQLYTVWFREQLPAALAEAIRAFDVEHDPYRPKPIEPCDPARVVAFEFSSTTLYYDTLLNGYAEPRSACGYRLCWSGEFREESPVGTRLDVMRVEPPLRCLGEPQSFVADLSPIVRAYERGYPGAERVVIDLALAGARGQALRLDVARGR